MGVKPSGPGTFEAPRDFRVLQISIFVGGVVRASESSVERMGVMRPSRSAGMSGEVERKIELK